MTKESQASAWRDWALFGLRWLLLGAAALTLFLSLPENVFPGTRTNITFALALGAVANVAYALLILVPGARKALPITVAVTDWIIGGLFVYAANALGNMPLIVAVIGGLMLASVTRLDTLYSFIQAVGLLVIAIAILMLGGTPPPTSTLLPPLLMLVMLAALATGASYSNERSSSVQKKRLEEVANVGSYLRERTRAIYEMAAILGTTLDYERILNAALDAGQVVIGHKTAQGIASAVMLFREEDNQLHVVASRRFTRADEGRIIPGKSGLIAEAFAEGAPVMGEYGRKDGELQYFAAFQSCRSVVCVPLRAGFENYGVLIYGSEIPNAFTAEHSELLTSIGIQATIALQNAVLYRNLMDEKERIVSVEEDARKKLARDLHDGPTQSVSAIAMRMSVIYKMYQQTPDQVPEELKKVEDIARKTAKEIRSMLFTLRPLVLESQGLAAALNQLAEKMEETYGQAVAVRVLKDAEQVLDKHQQGVVFYIVEEAVNNARKHAQAQVISVTVSRQRDVVAVQIADNGVGFNTEAVNTNYEARGSLGMVNMRERAALVDGTLHVQSAEGKGTSITVLVPIRGSQAATNAKRSTHEMTRLAMAAAERVETSHSEHRRR
jgi:signal transduction histidine kinase